MATERAYIYGLLCPLENKVRYIGQSKKPAERYKSHLRGDGRRPVAQWVRELAVKSLKPKLVILQIFEREKTSILHDSWPEVNKAERQWCTRLVSDGHDLLNHERHHAKTEADDERMLIEAIETGQTMFDLP